MVNPRTRILSTFQSNEQFAVVHNGIIENYQELKERLNAMDIHFNRRQTQRLLLTWWSIVTVAI